MEKALLYTHEVGKVLPMSLRYFARWSQGVRAANFVFSSGQPGVDNKGNVLAAEDPYRQAKYALDNVRRIIESGGASFADVFKVRVFLGFSAEYPAIAKGVLDYLADYFEPGNYPVLAFALSPVGASEKIGLLRVEIEGFAATDREIISTDRLHRGYTDGYPLASWSHAARIGNFVFTSGQLPVDERGALVAADPAGQMQRALANMCVALEAARTSPSEIVKLTTYVESREVFEAASDVRAQFFAEHLPGRQIALTTVVVPVGLPGVLTLVEAIAADGPREIVHTDAAPSTSPDGAVYAQAVKVPISSIEGSFLRRLTWPTYPADVDRSAIGLELAKVYPLGNIVFLSSQGPFDSSGRLVGRGDVGAQTRKVFENMRAVVGAAGGRFSDIAQVDFYLDHPSNYPAFNEQRVRFCEENVPDKNWFCGSGMTGAPVAEGAQIEIESIAAVE